MYYIPKGHRAKPPWASGKMRKQSKVQKPCHLVKRGDHQPVKDEQQDKK